MAGTLQDLYTSLARVAKLDVTSAEQQMVFAKISNGYFFSFEVWLESICLKVDNP